MGFTKSGLRFSPLVKRLGSTKSGPTVGQELPTSRNFPHRPFLGFYPSSASICRDGFFSTSSATRGWRLTSVRGVQAIAGEVLGLSTAQTTSNGFAKRGLLTRFTTGEGPEGKKWRFSAIILFLPCAATFGLGTWQLFRRQWKIEVLDYRRKRLEEEPIPLVNAISGCVEVSKSDEKNASPSPTAIEELEFRTVICEGVYDVKRNLYVGPRARSAFGVTQKGYFVITPLLPAEDSKSGQVPVLVNRGWVPSGWIEEPDLGHSVSTPAEATTVENIPWWKFWTRQQNALDSKGEVLSSTQAIFTVRGVIRRSEEPNIFVPSNVPSAGQWFYDDVPAMARTLGLPENTILIEVLQEPENSARRETFPRPKDPEALLHSSVMPQDHVNYALTWYSLSAAITFMAVKRVWGSRKGR